MADYREQAQQWAGPGRETAVDLVQAKLHFNESLHLHENIGDASCAYCWLRAGRAVMALAEAGLLSVPPIVWLLDLDGDPGDPEVFTTEDVAKDDAVRTYRDANQIGLFADDPEPVFEWRKHRDGGTELCVDGEATGMIVRQLTVKDAATAVNADV